MCFLMFWAWSLYLCIAGVREGLVLLGIPYWVYPLVFFAAAFIMLLQPFAVCGAAGRSWMLRTLPVLHGAPVASAVCVCVV